MHARNTLLLFVITAGVVVAAAVMVTPLHPPAKQVGAQGGLTVSLDMNADNDGGPCNSIDAAAEYPLFSTYRVAVCVTGLPATLGVFVINVLYDDTKNVAPEVANAGKGLDDNPDANEGTTKWGDGLGTNMDCSSGALAYPMGDRNPATGPGNGQAFVSCVDVLQGPWTLGDNETAGVLAVIDFQALAAGTDTLTLANTVLGDSAASEMGSCNPSFDYPMTCNGGEAAISATPVPTPTPRPAVGVDTDLVTAGVQASRALDEFGTFQVAIAIENLPRAVGSFQFDLTYDAGLLSGIEVADISTALDDNPDANAGVTTWPTIQGDDLGDGWDCSALGEAYPVAGGGRARIFCISLMGPFTLGDDETGGVLAVVTFETAGLTEAGAWLSLENLVVGDSDQEEIGSCAPVIGTSLLCNAGFVRMAEDPDHDGVPTSVDNCPAIANPEQTDTDSDEMGDACDPDDDNDDVLDAADNCPLESNAGQTNTDAMAIDNGPVVPRDDITVPNGDSLGDACDEDTDNDWLDNTHEAAEGTDPLDQDSDGDRVVDGYEVLLGTSPLDPGDKPSCVGIIDADTDCLPADVEAMFGSSDSIKDTDADGITDGVEVRGWGTSPTVRNTDGDICDDDKEIVEVNGDAFANSLDVGRVMQRAYNAQDDDPSDGDPRPDMDMQVSPAFDINKNGMVEALDVGLVIRNSNLVEQGEGWNCRETP